MHIAVVGAGSWGTAVARHIAHQGHNVSLWAHSQAVADGINANHVNPRYLSSCDLPQSIVATSDVETCVHDAEAVVLVTPSHALRAVSHECAPVLGAQTPVVVLTKGIEYDTGKLMIEVVADEIGHPERLACLSGPNHAEEVVLDLPAAAVVASRNPETAHFFQRLFHAETFRTYVSDDPTGVEICSAYKNVVAVSCGIAKGYGSGDNTCALIMTRGLAEMGRLVAARGGDPMTCLGLAGVGDLVATCTSQHSRNTTFGLAFSRGETLEAFQKRTHMVVEGALACRSVRNLAHSLGCEVPIADAVYALLYDDCTYEDIVESLCTRLPRVEFYGFDAWGMSAADATSNTQASDDGALNRL